MKKEILVQVFSCEFCEISKDTFLQRTPLVTACYSSLPNRLVARNKRGGGKDEPFLISVVPGIINGGENFYTSYSNKKKNKMN